MDLTLRKNSAKKSAVIPAKAGIHARSSGNSRLALCAWNAWIPAFAGMTEKKRTLRV
jgi:hypothetical protein